MGTATSGPWCPDADPEASGVLLRPYRDEQRSLVLTPTTEHDHTRLYRHLCRGHTNLTDYLSDDWCVLGIDRPSDGPVVLLWLVRQHYLRMCPGRCATSDARARKPGATCCRDGRRENLRGACSPCTHGRERRRRRHTSRSTYGGARLRSPYRST